MQLTAALLGLVPVVGVGAVGAVGAVVVAAAVATAGVAASVHLLHRKLFAHAEPHQGRARGLCRFEKGRLGRGQHQCCGST